MGTENNRARQAVEGKATGVGGRRAYERTSVTSHAFKTAGFESHASVCFLFKTVESSLDQEALAE